MSYSAIHSEGGLLPLDLLERIAREEVQGQKAPDFGLASGRRLTDEIAGVWSDAMNHWAAFRRRLSRLPEGDAATSVTRNQWVVPLLDLLGYELSTPGSVDIGGQTFAISHRAGEGPCDAPIHIEGIRAQIDRKGRLRLSPHALVQEYLNRSEHLWGIVTNGRSLRLLRQTPRSSRPSFLEFDLESVLEGNRFHEFAVLYRVCHRTRLPNSGEDHHLCLLERYYQEGIDQGGRIRDHLSDGVKAALEVLANGFLRHPGNAELRDRAWGEGEAARFHRELLLLVYRLLFLMVVEERRLVFPELAEDAASVDREDLARREQIYQEAYSVTRLRGLVDRGIVSSPYHDLWMGLSKAFALFRNENQLGVPPLNGNLFELLDLDGYLIGNEELLTAMRHLSRFQEQGIPRRVNYAGLDVEELGSVYESLLEFRPVVTPRDGTLTFTFEAGDTRRTTASHYTPPEFVRELIQHALEPVMEERLKEAKSDSERVSVLLNLNVLDPTCGSGHFLLAAARRIGREVAKLRSGEEEPAPDLYRIAVREAVTHCVHGVDKNPLAVDLCKVALWLEAHCPGMPLTFLDHRIKHGDSLVGVADLDWLKKGVPEAALKRADCAVNKALKPFRDRNKRELAELQKHQAYQMRLSESALDDHLKELAALTEQMEHTPDTSPQVVREKARRYEQARGTGSSYWADVTACHLWTAAFFAAPRSPHEAAVATTDAVLTAITQPKALDARLAATAWTESIDPRHTFFHWPLEFPDVQLAGGFDVVLGNPPFMGGQHISGTFGGQYRDFINTALPGPRGSADLCAYVFLRSAEVLRRGGRLGLVATNSIGQGATRQRGLAVLTESGHSIPYARCFLQWPRVANVEVNLVTIRKGPYPHEALLNGRDVPTISSYLDDGPEGTPALLPQASGQAFQGSNVLGLGFTMGPEEAGNMVRQNPRNANCLFPYLNGEDLNSRPDQSASRWVINFRDWPLDCASSPQGNPGPVAADYPDLLRIVCETVKPERERNRDRNSTALDRARHWWHYGRRTPALDRAVAPLKRVLVRSRISDTHGIIFVDSGQVYNEKTVVFVYDDYYHFAALQSGIHELWARRFSSTLRVDLSYTTSDCFETFPFPPEPLAEARGRADRLGGDYHEHRREVMLKRQLGLTKTYSLLNMPGCLDMDIGRLRELHVEMDRAVLACYGWQDVDPGHDFFADERGRTRFTFCPEARREVLNRLLELNLRLAGEGAAQSEAMSRRPAKRS
ncbi:MAG TPA: DNA methyltransferase [Armatimonadota bacterium]|jgi:hypothetical protein